MLKQHYLRRENKGKIESLLTGRVQINNSQKHIYDKYITNLSPA